MTSHSETSPTRVPEKKGVPMVEGRELDAFLAAAWGDGEFWDFVIDGCSRNGYPYPSRAEAEKGREVLRGSGRYAVGKIIVHSYVPHYHTEVEAAMNLVEAVRAKGYSVTIESDDQGTDWYVCFGHFPENGSLSEFDAREKDFALAVSIAAHKAAEYHHAKPDTNSVKEPQ